MQPKRHIAWDGLEFEVPADWELSAHGLHRQVGSLVLEDAFDVRLEMEWTVGGNPARIADIEKRHGGFARQVETTAAASRTLDNIPDPWLAQDYMMKDGRRLVSALHLGRGKPLMAFLRLHARQADGARLVDQARRLIDSFRYHADGPIPWRIYDFDLRIPRPFRLSTATFHAGRKLMVFERNFRRLFIWQFSLARRLLEREAPEPFAARFLNQAKALPGPRFAVAPDDRLVTHGKWHHPFGHYEEIGRACRRYHTQTLLDMERDRLLIVVFHYRSPNDLDWLRDVCPSERDADQRAFQERLRANLDPITR